MSDFRVTVESARNALADQRCINAECGSDGVDIQVEMGDTENLCKETYICRSCRTQWKAELYPGRVEEIIPPNGDPQISYITNEIESGVFNQIAYPKGPIVETVREFLNAMKMGSVAKKGEALAKLAMMMRMEL
jgi:hypothetical protein